MKHPSSRAFFNCWDQTRGELHPPGRSAVEADLLRDLSDDVFVLSHDPENGHPFRSAGRGLCTLLGHDPKGHSFATLFGGKSRDDIVDIVSVVTQEMAPTIVGISAADAEGAHLPLELLLLPFEPASRAQASLTGLLSPLALVKSPLRDLRLTSWRHIAPRPDAGPRQSRRWSMAPGFMVYEGTPSKPEPVTPR